MIFKGKLMVACLCLPPAFACSGDDLPETYEFESRFVPGNTSVSHSGQTLRHVLIADMTTYLGTLTEQIDTGAISPSVGDTQAALNFYYQFDDTGSASGHLLATTPLPMQAIYADIATGKNLREKIAGRDSGGEKDHKDWDGGGFAGWPSASPDALLQEWFVMLDDLAAKRALNNVPLDPRGSPITKVYLTPAGQDLRQLTQKFLLGAVVYAQATDDYLDEGLAADNTSAVNGKSYTALEHGFDEAYGYFGAARHYGNFTDDEIAGRGGREAYASGYHDRDGDGAIDLGKEYNFGIAQNAAKRDLGSNDGAKTDFSGELFSAFLEGRQIIASGPLDSAGIATLSKARDAISQGWEDVLAATCVHYINDTLRDMATFGTDDYSFEDHAKHWSELKGFALSLQFNPRKRITDEAFATLHGLIRNAPSLPGDGDSTTYAQGLRDARQILVQFYDIAPENIGDENGIGGW